MSAPRLSVLFSAHLPRGPKSCAASSPSRTRLRARAPSSSAPPVRAVRTTAPEFRARAADRPHIFPPRRTGSIHLISFSAIAALHSTQPIAAVTHTLRQPIARLASARTACASRIPDKHRDCLDRCDACAPDRSSSRESLRECPRRFRSAKLRCHSSSTSSVRQCRECAESA